MEEGNSSPSDSVELMIRYSLASDQENSSNKSFSKITTSEIDFSQLKQLNGKLLKDILKDDNVDVEQWSILRYFVPSMNGFKKLKDNEKVPSSAWMNSESTEETKKSYSLMLLLERPVITASYQPAFNPASSFVNGSVSDFPLSSSLGSSTKHDFQSMRSQSLLTPSPSLEKKFRVSRGDSSPKPSSPRKANHPLSLDDSSEFTPEKVGNLKKMLMENLRGLFVQDIVCGKHHTIVLSDHWISLTAKAMASPAQYKNELLEIRDFMLALTKEELNTHLMHAELSLRKRVCPEKKSMKQFFFAKPETVFVSHDKYILDFNVEDNCPLNMIVTDRFQLKNEGNHDIQFQILVPNSSVYLIDFDYRAGVITKNSSCYINIKMIILYPIFVNEILEIKFIDPFKNSTLRFLAIKINSASFLSKKWEIHYDELKLQDKIAAGATGVVHRGIWKEQLVAIKEVFAVRVDHSLLQRFQQEIAVLSSVHHHNIVKFLGACADPDHLLIVTELCENGNLYDFIHRKDVDISHALALKLSLDMAQGMEYLHSVNILHRDLKSLNILIRKDLTAVIADFGTSRIIDTRMTKGIGTPQWQAPEKMKGDVYTEKSDVYSYAIILWEIITREEPFANVNYYRIQELVVLQNLRPSLPENICDSSLRNLIIKCWDADPDRRLPFSDIVDILRALLLSVV